MTTKEQNIRDEWFQSSPVGLLAMDGEGQICGVNPALEKMLDLPAEKLLGHNKETINPESCQALFGQEEVIPLGKRQLLRQSQEHQVGGGTAVHVHYFHDISELCRLREENQRLRQQINDLTITDELTGLANRRALNQMLSAQVTRCRRYQNPFSLTMVEIATETPPSDDLVLIVSRYLRDRLRWADLIGRWDEGRFMLLLPETSGEAATQLLEKISRDVPACTVADPDKGFKLKFGLAEWRKGLDARKLVEQAVEAMSGEEAITVSCGS